MDGMVRSAVVVITKAFLLIYFCKLSLKKKKNGNYVKRNRNCVKNYNFAGEQVIYLVHCNLHTAVV